MFLRALSSLINCSLLFQTIITRNKLILKSIIAGGHGHKKTFKKSHFKKAGGTGKKGHKSEKGHKGHKDSNHSKFGKGVSFSNI